MSLHTANLNYGTIEDVTYILDNYPLEEGDLRAALLNAFRRIDDLEKQLNKKGTENG